MNRFVLRVLCWLLVLCYLSEDECEERGGGGGQTGGDTSFSSVVVDVNLTTEVSWGRGERRGAREWVQKLHKYSRQVKFFTWKKLI